MKQIISLFLCTLLVNEGLANINLIDVTRISKDPKHVAAFNSIKENKHYYDHWSNEWTYDKPKEELVKNLRDHYNAFSTIPKKTTELSLLLGDISHYLYNLDDSASYRLAVNNYNAALKASPADYRAYWFLGYHYALSNNPTEAINNFMKGEKLLPSAQPGDFWNDYAWATAVSNMPSHCIYAMDQVKKITGRPGTFETQLGETVRKRITDVDKDSAYAKKEIWQASMGEKTTFVSRPLGIKLLVDSTWNLSLYDYQKRQGIVILKPPGETSKSGKKITYTIALIMKTANDEDKIEDYLDVFISKYPDKKKVPLIKKYPDMIAYEIRDKTMYEDRGGGHMYMIGLESPMPAYPGKLLESPVTIPKGNGEQINYYRASESKNRFKGKIHYAILLDTCEDIHEQSLAVFKELVETCLIIE